MKTLTEVLEGVTVVRVDETLEVDMGNAADFKASTLEAIGDATRVALELSRVEFFDSAGMGALFSLQKRIAERGGTIVLVGLNRSVMGMFRMVGFDVVFVCVPDVAKAVARLKG